MNNFIAINKNLAPSMPENFFDNLDVPENTTTDSVYIYTLHKCASTMLHRIFQTIAHYNSITMVSIDRYAFLKNYKYTSKNIEEMYNIFLPKGYLYGVFRRFGLDQARDFAGFDLDKKSILLVRDPRDILTSLYFSVYYSHAAPGQTGKKLKDVLALDNEVTIDEYVLKNAPEFLKRFNTYIEKLIPSGQCLVFKYEDIIDSKPDFIVKSINHLGLNFPYDKVVQLATKEDIKPKQEDVNKHVRKVTPGDHKEKLKTSTILSLNNIFSNVLTYFEYEV